MLYFKDCLIAPGSKKKLVKKIDIDLDFDNFLPKISRKFFIFQNILGLGA